MESRTNELLTVAEVASLTRLKVPTIYAYAERRQIPHVKLGSRVLFEREALAGWLAAKRVEPMGGAA
jgi:excisionase family DNA binding protein